MKKLLLIIFIFILSFPAAIAIANYGDYIYGFGLYGKNTPPTISAFQPSDTTPQFNFTTNITFNITASDDDGDAITLIWEVNGTFNTSSQNMSYIFNKIGIFNVTGNITDGYAAARQEWIVTIINDTQEFVPTIIITPAPQPEGGGGFVTLPQLNQTPFNTSEEFLLNIFGTPPIQIGENLTCPEGKQLFDDLCYNCPRNGYLTFIPSDRSIACIQCGVGFQYNGSDCMPSLDFIDSITKSPKRKQFLFIMAVALVIGVALQERKPKHQEKEEEDEEII